MIYKIMPPPTLRSFLSFYWTSYTRYTSSARLFNNCHISIEFDNECKTTASRNTLTQSESVNPVLHFFFPIRGIE